MAATPRVPLGGQTLNRKWWMDVNTGTHGAPVWTPVGGMSDCKPVFENTFKDDSDYDSGGAQSEAATAYKWGAEIKVQRKVTVADATVYDPGQEAIRAKASQLGVANVAEIRYYEMNVDQSGAIIGPKTEAYQGYVSCSWTEEGGAMDELDTVSVTLSGRGIRNTIAHPEATQSLPTTTLASPNGGAAAGGTLVTIYGTGFFKAGVSDVTGATGVKFDSTNATSYTVLSDNVIVAIAPAHAAGTIFVKATNSAGASVTMCTFTYS
jgi:hypothetical protein